MWYTADDLVWAQGFGWVQQQKSPNLEPNNLNFYEQMDLRRRAVFHAAFGDKSLKKCLTKGKINRNFKGLIFIMTRHWKQLFVPCSLGWAVGRWTGFQLAWIVPGQLREIFSHLWNFNNQQNIWQWKLTVACYNALFVASLNIVKRWSNEDCEDTCRQNSEITFFL